MIIIKAISQCVWNYYFIPVIDSVPPEFHIPRLVKSFNIFVFFPQPYSERLFAVLAIAFSSIFVIDMPAYNVPITSIALCKFLGELPGILLIYETVWACIVPFSKFVSDPVKIRAGNFRILFHQPRRHCCC